MTDTPHHSLPASPRCSSSPRWTLATLWTRYCVDLFWLGVYLAANAVVFWLRFREYPSDPCVELSPAIAKGSAEAVMLNVVLTLLSVCHRVLDRLRSWTSRTQIATLAQRPLEMHRQFHVLTGSVIVVLSLVHTVAWCAIIVAVRSCELTEWHKSRLAQRETHELRDEASVWRLLFKLPMWTGIMMLLSVLALLPFCLPRVRRQHFQAFARVHSLVLVPLVALLLIHGACQWSSRFQAPLWLLPAIVIYFLERRSRLSSSTCATIVSYGIRCSTHAAASKATMTVTLYVTKTPRFQRCFQPGMFVYLQVPVVSALEWHPFSVASSQDDPLVELRIRIVGDWTSTLLTYLASLPTSSSLQDSSLGSATIPVCLDGPFGTPTAQYRHYNRVALVALGVGVSPFLSVLRQELHARRQQLKLRRVGLPTSETQREMMLIWVVRTLDHVHWLTDLLHEFDDVLPSTRHALDVHVYVTSPCDAEHSCLPAIDPSLLQLHCDGSRPQWTQIITTWMDTRSSASRMHGVFVSGSHTATSAIKSAVACVPMERQVRVDVFAEMFH